MARETCTQRIDCIRRDGHRCGHLTQAEWDHALATKPWLKQMVAGFTGAAPALPNAAIT